MLMMTFKTKTILPRVLVAVTLFGTMHGTACAEVPSKLQPEVVRALEKKVAVIQKYLSDPVVLKALSDSNKKNENIDDAQILKLDQRWRSAKGIDDFVKSYLVNPCSERLLDLQEYDDGFAEVFVTDLRGLNVCQSNKTSDLYQADEDWWQQSFAGGKGTVAYGDIEYDESAGSEAISTYVPVYQDKMLIGIGKAVIDITSLETEDNEG